MMPLVAIVTDVNGNLQVVHPSMKVSELIGLLEMAKQKVIADYGPRPSVHEQNMQQLAEYTRQLTKRG